MRTIQQSYAEPLVREAIIRSVRGEADDLVWILEANTDVEKIISELDTAYSTVLGYDVLMQQFYGIHMERNEKVQSYATRMERSLNQIWLKFPRIISNVEAKVKLRDRLFYGAFKTLRDSIRYLYDNPTVTYTQLLVAARNAEAEVSDGKLGTMTIKAKAATANDELVSLKQQVSDLVAVV